LTRCNRILKAQEPAQVNCFVADRNSRRPPLPTLVPEDSHNPAFVSNRRGRVPVVNRLISLTKVTNAVVFWITVYVVYPVDRPPTVVHGKKYSVRKKQLIFYPARKVPFVEALKGRLLSVARIPTITYRLFANLSGRREHVRRPVLPVQFACIRIVRQDLVKILYGW
jgi:hypothetical protein